MNRQDLIKDYVDYGFSAKDIAEELGIDEVLVKSALIEQKPLRTETPASSIKAIYKDTTYKTHATDKTMPMYELLYEYGPKELNRMIKNWGLKPTAEYLKVKWSILYSLKVHFGYHEPLPMDALHRITYFSDEIRKSVDERDNRECIRCERHIEKKNIRYHKISHPGPMCIDNCATLCQYCRHRTLKHIYDNYRTFYRMRYNDFRAWIHNNDAFVHRDRVYPKGKIGTW